jgi:hypothetical protein
MASSYVVRSAMAIIASLLTLSCAPPAASTDVGVDTAPIDDVGTDASYDWPDAFAMDASVEDILCTGMPVPRDLPCEAQPPATASGCGGMGRVVYEQSVGCRAAIGEACGPVRGAFNTVEECAMACGRVGRSPFPSRYQPVSGGKMGFRTGPLDFNPECDAVMRQDADFPHGISRCAHFGFLAPLYEGRRAGVVPVPDTMSNQEVWELLNAVELVGFEQPYRGPLCVTPL